MEEIIASIISSLIIVIGGYFYGKKALRGQHKIEIARQLYAARYEITQAYQNYKSIYSILDVNDQLIGKIYHSNNYKLDWNKALNSIAIVFAEDERVILALGKLHDNQNEDTIRELMVEVGIAAKLLKAKHRPAYLHNPIQLFGG